MRSLKVFFHDGCFDGVSSAAMFARFYRETIDAAAVVIPVGMAHRDGDPFQGVAFDADDHACVDFRFSPAPELRWWFDHHATAFQPAALRQVFEARQLPTHVFDAAAPSCAGLIARTLARDWSWSVPDTLRELAAWADRVDSLDYDSAATAVALTEPAQRLSVFLTSSPPAATAQCVRWLEQQALAEVAARPEVDAAARQALAERASTLALLRQRAVRRGDVICFDLLDLPGCRAPGLLGYYLFPDCQYVVSAVAGPSAVRVFVGHNPWIGEPTRLHVGRLCERYGGGGHAAVGGVTLEPHELERGAAVLAALLRELAG
jgi:hypothetical protein